MTRDPHQLLTALVLPAAKLVLASPAYAGEEIEPNQFAACNVNDLLIVTARLASLRAELRESFAAEIADQPLLRQLTGDDTASAEAAARALAQDPSILARSVGRRPKHPPKPTASTEDRRVERAMRAVAEARQARDRTRGQLEWANRERDAARQELATTIADRDEALAVIESLRAERNVLQLRLTTLASDTTHAARLLANAIRSPASPDTVEEEDPRIQDREQKVSEPPDPGPYGAADPRLAEALEAAGVPLERLLAFLDAVLAPPGPAVERVITKPRDISLTPLGGGTEIGGSCSLVEVGKARFLVDAGMRPRQPLDRSGPRDIELAYRGHLNAIVVTHAHNDHAGYIPALVRDHPAVTIICSPDTAALLPAMWADSVKVFARTRDQFVPYGGLPTEAPYGQPDATAAQQRINPLDFGEVREIADGVTVELFPAGHILGAAGAVITAGGTRVTVTGDVSDLAMATVPGLVLPPSARESDLLVIESTYCRPSRSQRASEVEGFLATVGETVASGGRVLVPAFALGRAQEIAMILRTRLPDVPVLIDGMAKQIAHIYEQQTAGGSRPLRIFGEQIREVAPGQRGELLTTFRRGVILATSGMLTAGPSVEWARSILPDPTAALLLPGYQDEESPGAALLSLANGDGSRFSLDGQLITVKSRIAKFGLSAHADRTGLTTIVDAVGPRHVMLVHGYPNAQWEFGQHLARRGHRMVRTARWCS